MTSNPSVPKLGDEIFPGSRGRSGHTDAGLRKLRSGVSLPSFGNRVTYVSSPSSSDQNSTSFNNAASEYRKTSLEEIEEKEPPLTPTQSKRKLWRLLRMNRFKEKRGVPVEDVIFDSDSIEAKEQVPSPSHSKSSKSLSAKISALAARMNIGRKSYSYSNHSLLEEEKSSVSLTEMDLDPIIEASSSIHEQSGDLEIEFTKAKERKPLFEKLKKPIFWNILKSLRKPKSPKSKQKSPKQKKGDALFHHKATELDHMTLTRPIGPLKRQKPQIKPWNPLTD